jgi:hypothetical protein
MLKWQHSQSDGEAYEASGIKKTKDGKNHQPKLHRPQENDAGKMQGEDRYV